MKYQRIIPLITPLSVWLLCQAFLRWPGFFYSVLAIGSLLIVLSVKYLVGREKSAWPLLTIAPVIFFLTFSCYAAIIIGGFWVQFLLVLIFWFLFVYLKNLYYYFTHKELESIFEDKLDNLLLVGSFLSVFTAATVLFSLSTFITWPLWATIMILAAVICLLFIQFMPFKRVNPEQAKALIMVSVLGLAELAWGLSFLPLKYHLLGLFMAIGYYLVLVIIRFHLQGNLNRRSLGAIELILLKAAFNP